MLETTSQIVQTDFSVTKFAGGVREAFQFVVYFTRKIDSAGLATILSPSILPFAEPPVDVLLTKDAHDKIILRAQAAHLAAFRQWDIDVQVHFNASGLIRTEPGVDAATKILNLVALIRT